MGSGIDRYHSTPHQSASACRFPRRLHRPVQDQMVSKWLEGLKKYQLGPKMEQQFFQDRIPTLSSTMDVHDDAENPCFRTVIDNFFSPVSFAIGVY